MVHSLLWQHGDCLVLLGSEDRVRPRDNIQVGLRFLFLVMCGMNEVRVW